MSIKTLLATLINVKHRHAKHGPLDYQCLKCDYTTELGCRLRKHDINAIVMDISGMFSVI